MKAFFEYVREFLSFSWYVSASLLGIFIKLQNPKVPGKKNILIVHGLGGQPFAFIFLREFLQKKGFSVYFLRVTMWESIGIGIKNIGTVTDSIESFVKKNNLQNLTLLGISAAGIPCLLFLENHNGWKYVKKFIALSAAFRGAWMSYVLFFIPLAHEYETNGVLQKKISRMRFKHPEKIVSLFGTWDEMIKPESSCLDNVVNIQLTEGGHAYLQNFSKKTFSKIAELAE